MQLVRPRMLSVGTANPPERYRQEDIIDLFEVPDPRIRSLFHSSHIQTRHLYLPPPDAKGLPSETQGQLLAKHLRGALEIGPQAVERYARDAQKRFAEGKIEIPDTEEVSQYSFFFDTGARMTIDKWIKQAFTNTPAEDYPSSLEEYRKRRRLDSLGSGERPEKKAKVEEKAEKAKTIEALKNQMFNIASE